MNRSLALSLAASTLLLSSASAQTAPIDYDFNWAPMANQAQIAMPGSFVFSLGGGLPPHPAGIGDAIRRCYSVDVTQGGRNERGLYETTWISFIQGWGAANPIPGTNVGLVSIQSATDSDLGGDACLSPWFSSTGNTGGHKVSVAAVLGIQTSTSGAAFPQVWQSVFQWTGGTSTGFTGVSGENVIGTDALGLPLLANVIFEIQGPSNAQPGSMQYYLGTTDENTGAGSFSATPARGTGGVTNGNSNWGFSLFGATADQSGAISHTRVFGFGPAGALSAAPAFWGQTPGSGEANAFVAFSTPFLWAENNGSIGAGGPDWNVSTGTPSQVQIWLKDIKSGAEGNNNLFWQTGGSGPPSAIYDPTLLFNAGYFFWSSTPAGTMQQLPMSWDDLGGARPPKAGSYLLSANTIREGVQSRPANLDPLMLAMLGRPGLTIGTPFTGAESLWFAPPTGSTPALFEGMTAPVVSGISKLSFNGGAPFPAVPTATPSLAGINIGIAAFSLQVRTDPVLGVRREVAEFASSLTLTLQ